jgi:hypothetical protein
MRADDSVERERRDGKETQLQLPIWELFSAYENGKSRRYALLFTINGGAYALIGFLARDAKALVPGPLYLWAFIIIPLAMILFSWKMCDDIRAFGESMRKLDLRPPDQRVFGPPGKSLLSFIRVLLFAGWAFAIGAAVWSWFLPAA